MMGHEGMQGMGRIAGAMAAVALLLTGTIAQARTDKASVYSQSVEGNLEGNSANRTVFVVLPPSYDKAKKRRYPVVYFLHGFTATAQQYMDRIKFGEVVQQFATANEMIVVVPDTYTRQGGSFYASGPTVGNFEAFIARDLVAWVDSHYRTLPNRDSRGLAGHSMGGYGALRIGMKHPEVFSSLYAMSSCCLAARRAMPDDAKYEAMTLEQALAADFIGKAYFANAAAFSPNPGKAPFFADLVTRDGKPDPSVEARWAANAPNVFVGQYVPALKSMEAISMDSGDKDNLLPGNEEMDRELTRFGIAHSFTLYDGDHSNRIPQRVRDFVLPFFAQHLDGAKKK